jgi:hypothetical protein
VPAVALTTINRVRPASGWNDSLLSQRARRSVGAWRASFYYYAIGVVASRLSWPFTSASSEMPCKSHRQRIGLQPSGLSLLAAVVHFTQGLIKGSIAVVAPVTASYGAVTTLFSMEGGEHLTVIAIIGIALTIAGACGCAIPDLRARLSGRPLPSNHVERQSPPAPAGRRYRNVQPPAINCRLSYTELCEEIAVVRSLRLRLSTPQGLR